MGSSARGCRIRDLFRTYSTRFMRTRHFHVQLGSRGAKKWPQQKTSCDFPGLYPSKSPYWNVVKTLLEPSVCLVCSYWPPGGHMVVGRQPHGGQNEQKMKKWNKNFLKPNGIRTQKDSSALKNNAFNGLFGVSGKLIFITRYPDKRIQMHQESCDRTNLMKNAEGPFSASRPQIERNLYAKFLVRPFLLGIGFGPNISGWSK